MADQTAWLQVSFFASVDLALFGRLRSQLSVVREGAAG
jgi:hypothetical protein